MTDDAAKSANADGAPDTSPSAVPRAARRTTGDFVGAIGARSTRARGLAFAVAAVVTAAALGLIGEMGVSHVMRFGHDDFIFLDGGWRVLSGQRPHVDFHTPLGLVTPLLFGLAMKIGHADATALGVGVILFTAVATCWAWAIAEGRLAPWLGAGFAVLVAATGAGQYTLSFDYLETSHASVFNRFGYAVLSIVLLECLLPAKDAGRRRAIAGAASTGAALAVLFFIKPSFVAQGSVLVVMSAWLVGRERARWLSMAAGAALASVALMVAARTTPAAVFADYAMGAASRTASLATSDQTTLFMEMSRRDSFSMTPAKVLEILRYDFWSILGVIGLAALVPSWGRFTSRRAVLGLTAIVLVSSLPIVFTNWQWGEVPTTAALALILAELVLRDAPAAKPASQAATRRLLPVVAVAIAFFVWGQVALKNLGSIVAAWSWHQGVAPNIPEDARFSAPPIRDLVVLRSDGYCKPNQYAAKVNDGLTLLASGRDPRPKIFVADFSNPFTFALAAPPPLGGEMWWHLGATFNATHAPSAAEVLDDVDVVMIPKCPEEPPTRDAILGLYGPSIDHGFTKTGETPYWAMFERRR